MIQIGELAGWRRNISAFLFGVCAIATLAPFYFFPLIIPAYGGLFLLVLNASSSKRAFADGWWWGWGFYISGLYWFCIALLTDAEKFAWAIPFALYGLNAVIALYPALACLLYYFLSFPRRRESLSDSGIADNKIPACAGMTRKGLLKLNESIIQQCPSRGEVKVAQTRQVILPRWEEIHKLRSPPYFFLDGVTFAALRLMYEN